MELFGLGSVEIVFVICIVGTILKVWVGRMRNPGTKININAIGLSFVVGIIAAVGLVAPAVDAIDEDTSKIQLLPILTGLVFIVMKSDSITKTLQLIIPKKSNDTSTDTKTPEVKNG